MVLGTRKLAAPKGQTPMETVLATNAHVHPTAEIDGNVACLAHRQRKDSKHMGYSNGKAGSSTPEVPRELIYQWWRLHVYHVTSKELLV